MDSKIFCQGCVYVNCRNLKSLSSKTSFFAFPVKDEARCKRWLINCGNKNLYDMEKIKLKNRVICEMHFELKYMSYSGRKKNLTRNAVPRFHEGKLVYF